MRPCSKCGCKNYTPFPWDTGQCTQCVHKVADHPEPADYDADAPYQVHSETSHDAAASMTDIAGQARKRVYEFVFAREEHGATDEEIALGLPMNPSTARPRRIELEDSKHIVKAGFKRKNLSDRWAEVYVAAKFATSD